jgi:hypothetical protein
VRRINEARQLRRLARELRVRGNWHEPDEQGVTAVVHGTDFDNAGFWGRNKDGSLDTFGDPPKQEIWVELLKDGEPVAEVNLATLFAMATGHDEGLMGDTEMVPVISLHVSCALKVRCLDQPGHTASDSCGYPADGAVEMPDGDLLWRCPQHWNVRWVMADYRTAQVYPGESRTGPSHARVPRPR